MKIWFEFLKKLPRSIWAYITLPLFVKKFKKNRKENEVIISLYSHFGDVVYGMLYAKEYKKETGLNIVVYCDEKLQSFVENYDCIDRILTYKSNTLQHSYVEVMPLRFKKMKKHGIIATIPMAKNIKTQTAKSTYKKEVYGVKEDKIELITLKGDKITSISDFEKNKNKIVVLNPFSNSICASCVSPMEKLVEILNSKGYICYTNVVGKQKPLNGTLPLKCKVEELYSILNEIPLFVSLRSGIVDTMLNTKCNMFVITSKYKKYYKWFDLYELRTRDIKTVFLKNERQTDNLILEFNEFLTEIEKK